MNLGVIGTGAMGGAMVANLLQRGHAVAIRDIEPTREHALIAAGAVAMQTPRSLVDIATTVFIVVETAAQIDAVLQGPDGLLAGLHAAQTQDAKRAHSTTDEQPTRAVFLCSTIAPADAQRFCKVITDTGAAAIDAPISGGPARARDGSMSMMLAAPAAVLDAQQAIIDQVAGRLFRVSARHGDAARAKLANNLAAGAYLVAASEALAMAVRMGLDPVTMQSLMAASSGQSWIADDRLPRAIVGLSPTVGAATRVLAKDLDLALAAAAEVGAQVPMGEVAHARFVAALEAGLGEHDDSAVYATYGVPRTH